MAGRYYRSNRRGWVTAGIVTLGIVAVLILLGTFLFYVNRFTFQIELNGPTDLTVHYGQDYKDAGSAPKLSGTILFTDGIHPGVAVTAEGQVDMDKVGTYVITYTSKFLGWTATAQRTVHVVDEIAPQITLVSDPNHLTAYGEAYEEEGYTAWDEHDGDITHLVQAVEKDGVVVYTVSDSSGNQVQVTRTIQYYDPTPPKIVLTGGENYTTYFGDPYLEPGYTAIDNFDGDVSGNVQISGEVDTFTMGTYTMEYTVTDSCGNTATVTRIINVEPHPVPETVYPSGKVIYLTFDDGPSAYTNKLLDVLAKYNAKATFFVIDSGRYSEMKRIVEEGHSIGIHSVTHNFKQIYASMDAYFEDLYSMQQIIYEQTGVLTTLMRFPGGGSNTVSRFNKGIMTKLTQAVQDAGFQYYDWHVDSGDASGANTSLAVFHNVIYSASGWDYPIVLQHDTNPASVSAVESILQWGQSNGYTFLALDPTSPTIHHKVNN